MKYYVLETEFGVIMGGPFDSYREAEKFFDRESLNYNEDAVIVKECYPENQYGAPRLSNVVVDGDFSDE